MNRLSGINVLFLCCVSVVAGFAQTAAPSPKPPSVSEELRRRGNNQSGQLGREESAARTAVTRRGALPFKKRISRQQKKMLSPDAADLSRYADFLRDPKTGLVKLFPDLGCEGNANIVRADAICLNQIPMSAFYSFRESEHTTDFLSDIRLENDVLVSDGLLTQGILVALGKTPLESVTPTSSGLKFLTEFKPELKSEEALKQTYRLIKGIKSDGYLYCKALPAREEMTYALRVVAYRAKFIQTVRGFLFDMLEGDDRVDVTIAFRLLKKDAATGSYTLLWKELARREAPKIIFPKRDRNQNRLIKSQRARN